MQEDHLSLKNLRLNTCTLIGEEDCAVKLDTMIKTSRSKGELIITEKEVQPFICESDLGITNYVMDRSEKCGIPIENTETRGNGLSQSPSGEFKHYSDFDMSISNLKGGSSSDLRRSVSGSLFGVNHSLDRQHIEVEEDPSGDNGNLLNHVAVVDKPTLISHDNALLTYKPMLNYDIPASELGRSWCDEKDIIAEIPRHCDMNDGGQFGMLNPKLDTKDMQFFIQVNIIILLAFNFCLGINLKH